MPTKSHSRLAIHFVVNFAVWQKQKIKQAMEKMTEKPQAFQEINCV